MNRLVPFAVAAATLSAWLPAQTSVVIPAGFDNVDGNGLDPEPFGFNQITHIQYVDRALLGAVPNGAMLSQIAYRRDWAQTPTVATMQRISRGQPTPAIWEIWMQNYTGPVLNPPNLIVRTGWTAVMTPILVNFPDLPRGTGPTAPFDLAFVLDRPFLYGGGHLGILHAAYESTSPTFDYMVDAIVEPPTSGTTQLLSPTAAGCPVDQNRCNGFAPNPGGGNLEFWLYGSKPSAPAVAYLGSNTTSWMGAPLPLGLGFLGLGACSIYTDLLVPLPAPTNIAGTAAVQVPVPADPALCNNTLYGQWLVQDDRVNPAVNLATSDGLAFTLGPVVGVRAFPMSTVSAAQGLARGRAGYTRLGEGLVFRLTF